MGYRLQLCQDLSSIAPEFWDSVVTATNGGVFYSSRWLRAYETGAPHHNQAYHLLAYKDRQLVGIFPIYLMQGCPRLEAHRKYVLTQETSLREPMLLAHSFYSYYGGPLVIDEDPLLYQQFLDAFQQLASDLRVEVYGIINIPSERTLLLSLLRDRAYSVRYLSSTMYMPVCWHTFDEYLANFKRERRRLIRKVVHRAERLGLSAEFTATPESLDSLMALEENILQRHTHVNTDLYPRRYWKALLEHLGESGKFLLIRSPEQKIICFSYILDAEKQLTPWIAGIDYEALKVYEPYHFTYCWLIQYAIDHGYQAIDMGRGSYHFKQRYGFQRRILNLALNTPFPELKVEVDRWSQDLAARALKSYASHFPDKEQDSHA